MFKTGKLGGRSAITSNEMLEFLRQLAGARPVSEVINAYETAASAMRLCAPNALAHEMPVTMSSMDNGWQDSAEAWIANLGEHGDFGRRYVLDPVMLPRALARSPRNALDVGCGEGRFCRLLKQHGVDAIGIDPTPALIGAARSRDANGAYVQAAAERLPFPLGMPLRRRQPATVVCGGFSSWSG